MKKIITLSALLMLGCSFYQAKAQDREIKGKVTSKDDDKGIPGVTVVVKGTSIGTASDIDGTYDLKGVPIDAKTLVFSAVGLKTQEITLTASDVVDVSLETDALKLDQVVVTANAISREKRSLGYATTQVDNKDLTQGENTNVIGALQGKVAGVDISSLSGGPGSSQRIVIRGGTSLLGNNQPLFVVDGVPISNANNRTPDPTNNFTANDLNDQTDYGNRANDINPDDIESISVLKGPAAAALYGSQASNGAIIITTKKGRKIPGGASKMEVSFSSSVTFSSILKLPDFQNQFGQGNVDPGNIADDRRENFSWGLPFDGKERPWGQEINGMQQVKPYVAIPDNVKDFFDLGVAYNNHVSFSGASDKSSYLVSMSAMNSNGIVPTTSYDKYSVLFNGSSELTNHFTTSISLDYTNISSSLPSAGQGTNSLYGNLLETARDIPIVDGKDLTNPFNAYNDATGTYGFYGSYYDNPYFIINNFKSIDNVDRMFGNVSVSYHNWDWLTVTDRLGGDFASDRREEDWKKFSYTPLDESGLYPWNNQISNGKYQQDNYNTFNYTNDLMATIKRKLTNDITGSLLLGQNIKQFKTNEIFAQTNVQNGLNLPGYYNLANSNGNPVDFNELIEKRIIGYYAGLDFAYKNYIFLGFTGRNDKSSTLYGTPTDNYFYPSVNASFVFSELMHGSFKDNILSYGKIRASYAKVGNDANPYVTSNVYQVTSISGNFGNTQFPIQYPTGSVPGFSVYDQVGNSKIAPEFTKASEIGTELGFLNDRLSVDFSYYMNSSTNQIIPLALPYSTGFTSEIINAGEVKNNGIELAVRGTPVSTKSGFKWELYGTYTKNTSEVVSLYAGVQQLIIGGLSGMSVVAQVGQPYGDLYAINLEKDPQGRVVVDPTTGLPVLTTNVVNNGSYLPKFIASWGTALSYKGFKFNVLFDTKQGGVIYSQTKAIVDFNGTAAVTATNGRQDYVWPNSVYINSSGQYVANTTPFHQYTYYTSVEPFAFGQMIVDASYIKLREVSLSYDFPAKWINRTPFGSASIGVFGNNLFLWTAASNKFIDPEQNSAGASNIQGFEFQPTPSQRNYGVDLKFTF